MECRYCQAANADDDHRCRRCGRRLRMSPVYTGSSAAAPVLQNKAAPVLQYEAAPVLRNEAAPVMRPDAASGPQRVAANRHEAHRAPEPSAPRRPITYQPSLFSSRELPQVVRFETIAPGLVQPTPRKPQLCAAPGAGSRFPASSNSPSFSRPRGRPSRPTASFIAMPRLRSPPIAPWRRPGCKHHGNGAGYLRHRIPPGGRGIRIKRQDRSHVMGVAAGVVIFYRLLWCLANGDTAGQRWTRLGW